MRNNTKSIQRFSEYYPFSGSDIIIIVKLKVDVASLYEIE